MPSTPSQILRLELIGTGDQAGTWGNTTNTNFGTLLEGAIAGLASVSVTSANQALTATDYAADQARMAILTLTTTTAANFNVYAPPVSKTYVVYNNSAYDATIFNSTALGNTTAAGLGVTIPAGRIVSVWSNGTNFRRQTDQFEGNTTTQVLGTNTTALASTAFVQAAVQAAKEALHPVGSIYINATNNTNPATLLGFGTWTAFGAGRVPVGFDSGDPLFDTAEETGGSKDAVIVDHTHTGTTGNQSANHTHSGTTAGVADHNHTYFRQDQVNFLTRGAGGSPNIYYNYEASTTGNAGAHDHTFTTGNVSADHNHSFTTDATGSSGTNANLQPYITVYMWKRTA